MRREEGCRKSIERDGGANGAFVLVVCVTQNCVKKSLQKLTENFVNSRNFVSKA